MAAKAGDNNNGSRKWKPCARKRGESGGESTLGLEHRRNQVFDAAHMDPMAYGKVNLLSFRMASTSCGNIKTYTVFKHPTVGCSMM